MGDEWLAEREKVRRQQKLADMGYDQNRIGLNVTSAQLRGPSALTDAQAQAVVYAEDARVREYNERLMALLTPHAPPPDMNAFEEWWAKTSEAKK